MSRSEPSASLGKIDDSLRAEPGTPGELERVGKVFSRLVQR